MSRTSCEDHPCRWPGVAVRRAHPRRRRVRRRQHAHSYVPPQAAAPGWTPSPGAVLLAAFWPAAVFVAVEIMARASWADGRRWVLVRWGGLAPVALVAAVVSYRHLAGLLGYYGEDPVTVAIGPLAVDG